MHQAPSSMPCGDRECYALQSMCACKEIALPNVDGCKIQHIGTIKGCKNRASTQIQRVKWKEACRMICIHANTPKSRQKLIEIHLYTKIMTLYFHIQNLYSTSCNALQKLYSSLTVNSCYKVHLHIHPISHF